MLKMNLDVILVLTQADFTMIIVIILNRGISVIVEKPICLIPEQAFELDKIAKSNNIFISSVFQNRYNPAILKLKNHIDSGGFGKLVTASIKIEMVSISRLL